MWHGQHPVAIAHNQHNGKLNESNFLSGVFHLSWEHALAYVTLDFFTSLALLLLC